MAGEMVPGKKDTSYPYSDLHFGHYRVGPATDLNLHFHTMKSSIAIDMVML